MSQDNTDGNVWEDMGDDHKQAARAYGARSYLAGIKLGFVQGIAASIASGVLAYVLARWML